VKRVVFVRGHHNSFNRQAHLLRHIAGVGVAEIAAGHGEGNGLAGFLRRLKIGREVINRLRRDARPVDRIDRAKAVFGLECGVGVQGFNEVLTVVERAANGHVHDVFVVHGVHLRALENAHAACGRQHDDAQAGFAAQRLYGGAARVAGRGAEDGESLFLLAKRPAQQIAHQLHCGVLKGERGPVRQFQERQAFVQWP